jgi:hypothetical protein
VSDAAGWLVVDTGLVLPVVGIRVRGGQVHLEGRLDPPHGQEGVLTAGRHVVGLVGADRRPVSAYTADIPVTTVYTPLTVVTFVLPFNFVGDAHGLLDRVPALPR